MSEPVKAEKVEQHPYVDDLVPDPADPPRLVHLRGFLGRSSQGADWIRLYGDRDVSYWLDIHETRVHAKVPVGRNPADGSLVWIKVVDESTTPAIQTGAVTVPDELKRLQAEWNGRGRPDSGPSGEPVDREGGGPGPQDGSITFGDTPRRPPQPPRP